MTTRNGYAQRTGPVECDLDSDDNITSIFSPGLDSSNKVSITNLPGLTGGNAFTGDQSVTGGVVSINTTTPTTGSQLTVANNGTGTNQYGLKVDAQSGATNNYAVHLNNAAASNVWNVYVPGTAASYFAGTVGIGTNSSTDKVAIAGTTNDGISLTSSTQNGTGRALYVLRNVASATRAMVTLAQAHTSGGTQQAVHIQQAVTTSVALGISTDGTINNFTVTGSGNVTASGFVRLGAYTVAGVPNAVTSGAGAMIYVSDEAGGAVMAFSNGTNWLRCTDRAIIS